MYTIPLNFDPTICRDKLILTPTQRHYLSALHIAVGTR